VNDLTVSLRFAEADCGLIEIDFDCAVGGRAVSWRVDGVELLAVHGNDPVEHGMYVMAPWAGRLAKNAFEFQDVYAEFPATYGQWAVHGVVMNAPCPPPVITETAEFVQAVFTSELTGWPWPAQVQTTWVLDRMGLRTEIEVSTPTSSEASFPAVVGWHPWFRREILPGSFASWGAPSAQLAVRDGAFATGELVEIEMAIGPFDDAFHVPDRTLTVAWPGWGHLVVENSAPWFVVFDELPGSLCIEPQTNAPNAMNLPVIEPCEMVRAGQPLRLMTSWRIERDRLTAGS
jgi:galactose mutarotase-like enzyme